jgi:UDP-N-acetylglucosamine 2-epimerase (non-hydrolysing)
VVVQGDTATAMVGALAAYYRRIPVAHVEAGLRSGDIYAPWPEEVNRKIVGVIADQHFAPTERAAAELVKENVPRENIYVTGNTVVDALLTIRQWVGASNCPWQHIRQRKGNRRLILVTAHRRENHGERLEHIVDALKQLLKRDDIIIVLPVHPNPNVQDVLRARLAGEPNVEIVSPPPYLSFVSLMMLSDIVLTDSGGIQEEAPTLGKPVLVLRDTTERPEGVEAGTAILVGSQTDRIVAETQRLLDCPDRYRKMSRAHSPFGDGHASERIVRAMLDA